MASETTELNSELLSNLLKQSVTFSWELAEKKCKKTENYWKRGIIHALWKTLSPGQTRNVWRPNTTQRCLVTKHFTVWTPWLVLLDRVWSCVIKLEGHQTFDQKLETFRLLSCLMGDVLFAAYQTYLMWACVPHLISGLSVSIVWSVFDQTCFNLFSHSIKLSIFGHQTMFDGAWSPNTSRLSRPSDHAILLLMVLYSA